MVVSLEHIKDSIVFVNILLAVPGSKVETYNSSFYIPFLIIRCKEDVKPSGTLYI